MIYEFGRIHKGNKAAEKSQSVGIVQIERAK